jgi:hypothetical protein
VPGLSVLPFVGRDEGEESVPEPEAETAAVYASSSPQARELGAEQVASGARGREEQVRVAATIVEFHEMARGGYMFELDNGQVWRQLDASRSRLRLREDDDMGVEIWPSGFGGYRMKVADKRGVVIVERVD